MSPFQPNSFNLCLELTFPKADAPAQMCVKLNCFWVAKMRGVSSSVKESFSFNSLNTSIPHLSDALCKVTCVNLP